ncbi:MAG: hypothetical protein ACJ8J7_15440, partial [Sulfurifustaceae bacterium]
MRGPCNHWVEPPGSSSRAALNENAMGFAILASFGHVSFRHESWTTHGLKQGMRTFFTGTRARLEDVSRRADALKREIETIYG